MLWCSTDGTVSFPTEKCEGSEGVLKWYSIFASFAIGIHWGLCVDFAVFNTGLSAFVLVVAQVMSEIVRFVIALVFLLLTFGSAISVLEHGYKDMQSIFGCAVSLFAITVKLYEHDYRNLRSDPALLTAVFGFVTATSILLLNLLTAQLNCSYEYIYQASVGFARLNRAEVIVETLKSCPDAKWRKFLKTLRFDERLEFNEGDVGLAGGLQVQEPAYLNPVTHDRIFRFGGSCSPEMQWPEDTSQSAEGEEEKLARLEDLVASAMKRLTKSDELRLKHSIKKGESGGASGNNMSGMEMSGGSMMADDYEVNSEEFSDE